jgi:uncharacterized protein YukE
MADQVIASPETMRDFARYLDQSNHQLADVMNSLSSRLGSLGDTWRDDHYHQFEDTFSQAATMVNRFLEQSESYVRYLDRKAEYLENYQQERLPQ